ncbi:Ig-like domain repeat protein [Nocardia jinanensis]|uniref:Bacterial Ig-like domain-containing protein n=1 Tax=Nocardia jinanensis TaxID=382504 RepID=A0A917RQW8_9NOCA|nr:Ig-like domain repeat protein [Nocardia jinanensis]GGL20160.1 hypothetical protein GCM10011588_38670 [Nocardia jinanensis]
MRVNRFRGPARAVAAAFGTAALVVAPLISAPAAHAAVAPVIRLAVTGGPTTASANTVPTGCTVTVEATVTLPDGDPVEYGTVQFFNRLPGNGDVPLGKVAVAYGRASVQWTPSANGANGLSAGYADGLPDILPVSAGIEVTARPGLPLGGLCL